MPCVSHAFTKVDQSCFQFITQQLETSAVSALSEMSIGNLQSKHRKLCMAVKRQCHCYVPNVSTDDVFYAVVRKGTICLLLLAVIFAVLFV